MKISLFNHNLIGTKPSEFAAASTLLAASILGTDTSLNKTLTRTQLMENMKEFLHIIFVESSYVSGSVIRLNPSKAELVSKWFNKRLIIDKTASTETKEFDVVDNILGSIAEFIDGTALFLLGKKWKSALEASVVL